MGKKLDVDHVGITKAFIGDKEWIPLNQEYSNYNERHVCVECKHLGLINIDILSCDSFFD